MKKVILINGLIAGLIVTGMMVVGTSMLHNDPDFKGSMVVGFLGMFIAFCFAFIGIKQYRDKYSGGHISFWKGVKIGVLISLVASLLYVGVWAIEYHFVFPDFIERYSAIEMKNLRESGASATELASKEAELKWMSDNYSNPFFFFFLTMMEIFPIGLAISLLSAAILMRKPKNTPEVTELGHS